MIKPVEIEQQSLVGALTERLNDADTAWVVSGHYELRYVIRELLAVVPLLADSVAKPDGFAFSPGTGSDWIAVDAALGSAVFLIPGGPYPFNQDMHRLRELQSELSVNAVILGTVNPSLWQTLGSGPTVVAAHDFLRWLSSPAAEPNP